MRDSRLPDYEIGFTRNKYGQWVWSMRTPDGLMLESAPYDKQMDAVARYEETVACEVMLLNYTELAPCITRCFVDGSQTLCQQGACDTCGKARGDFEDWMA